MVRKVLLIRYPFPDSMGGNRRTEGLEKYLPEFGWEIVEPVLSGELPLAEMVHDDLKKKAPWLIPVARRVSEVVNYPDAFKGWAREYYANLDFTSGFDAILSSSPPVSAHVLARQIKRDYAKLGFNKPWIADLRDLWSQNHNYRYSRLRHRFDESIELKVLQDADRVTTVSQPFADSLKRLHSRGWSVEYVPNGYDPETLNNQYPLTKAFTITYTGTVYPNQNAELFNKLIGEMVGSRELPYDIQVRFYNDLPHEEAILKQRESQVLLYLGWDDESQGVIASKLFEYLAAKRPILMVGESCQSAAGSIVKHTNAGVVLRRPEVIKQWLKANYEEFKKTRRVPYFGLLSNIQDYSHRAMARKFSEILEVLCREKH